METRPLWREPARRLELADGISQSATLQVQRAQLRMDAGRLVRTRALELGAKPPLGLTNREIPFREGLGHVAEPSDDLTTFRASAPLSVWNPLKYKRFFKGMAVASYG